MHNNRLLKNREFLDAVDVAISTAQHEIYLISAFLKTEVLLHLSQKIDANVNVTIISRWRLGDMTSGASDIEAFNIARSNDWSFYIDNDLHAKALLVDSNVLFLGSANYTAKGMHLFGRGNNELNIELNQ